MTTIKPEIASMIEELTAMGLGSDFTELEMEFYNTWNPVTKRHEPQRDLFIKMFDHDSMILLTNVEESWIGILVEEQGLEDAYFLHKYNADEEMRCLQQEAWEERQMMNCN